MMQQQQQQQQGLLPSRPDQAHNSSCSQQQEQHQQPAPEAAPCRMMAVPRARVVRLKVISMGDQGVGKSCLIKRYCEGRFVSRYVPTIGIDYGVKPLRLGGHELRVSFWDLAGPPAYRDVRCEFYRGAQAALLAYDASSRASFEGLAGWLAEAAGCGAPPGMAVFVVATKGNLPGRRVSEAEGREWAAARGHAHFDACAATGRNVHALFAALFAAALRQLPGVDAALLTCAADAAAAASDEPPSGLGWPAAGAGLEAEVPRGLAMAQLCI